jgi:hypothetical protein
MPSEPSLKAIADNLRRMVDAFERTPIGRQEITPGGGTTIADVLRFVVPQSEGDLAMEAVGGPAGKAIGQLLSVIPLGVVGRLSKKQIAEMGQRVRRRFRDTDEQHLLGENDLNTLIDELNVGVGVRDQRLGPTRGQMFGTTFDVGGEKAEVSGIEAVAGLMEGMTPEQIRQGSRLSDIQVRRGLPFARLDVSRESREAALNALDNEEFALLDLLINPETGDLGFADSGDMLDLMMAIQASGKF